MSEANVANFNAALGTLPEGTPRVVIGYNTDYAVYVHEILTSRHPQGQAKFLEAAINNAVGSQMLENAIGIYTRDAKTLEELYAGIARAVENTAMQIPGDSQQLCPILTGALAASANWQGEDGPGSGANPNGITVTMATKKSSGKKSSGAKKKSARTKKQGGPS